MHVHFWCTLHIDANSGILLFLFPLVLLVVADVLRSYINEEPGGIASALDGAEECRHKDQEWNRDDGQPDSKRDGLLEEGVEERKGHGRFWMWWIQMKNRFVTMAARERCCLLVVSWFCSTHPIITSSPSLDNLRLPITFLIRPFILTWFFQLAHNLIQKKRKNFLPLTLSAFTNISPSLHLSISPSLHLSLPTQYSRTYYATSRTQDCISMLLPINLPSSTGAHAIQINASWHARNPSGCREAHDGTLCPQSSVQRKSQDKVTS